MPLHKFLDVPRSCSIVQPVDDESVLQVIDYQILLLEKVNKSEFGYIGLVENVKEINLKDASGYQALTIHQKSMFLILALTLTKENMSQRT